jgi:ferritin-like protein
MTLNFTNQYETKGAEIIFSNIAGRYLTVYSYTVLQNSLIVQDGSGEESVLAIAQRHPDWAFIDAIGRYEALKDALSDMEKAFDSSGNKEEAVTNSVTNIYNLIAPWVS